MSVCHWDRRRCDDDRTRRGARNRPTERTGRGPFGRANAIAPLLRNSAGASEAQGKLVDAVADALHDTRLYGIWTPRVLGGAECDPISSLEIVQTLAVADASTAWVHMTTSLAIGTAALTFRRKPSRRCSPASASPS